jgi:hypothetical protein
MTMPRGSVSLAALALSGCLHTGKPSGPPSDQPSVARPPAESPAEAQALAGFLEQLKGYAELHDRLEKTLPPLPKETNPQVIDTHQRALAQLIEQNRKAARRGDLFTPAGEAAIRRILAEIFSSPDGAKFKSTIMDENPSTVKLAVNGRYPDEVPVSTMPPQVLARLPKLPEELEYRFIGSRLILLDVHSHTVADYIENILPR